MKMIIMIILLAILGGCRTSKRLAVNGDSEVEVIQGETLDHSKIESGSSHSLGIDAKEILSTLVEDVKTIVTSTSYDSMGRVTNITEVEVIIEREMAAIEREEEVVIEQKDTMIAEEMEYRDSLLVTSHQVVSIEEEMERSPSFGAMFLIIALLCLFFYSLR